MNIQINKNLETLQPYPVNQYLAAARSNAEKFTKIILKHNTENKPVYLFVRGSSGIIIGTFMCDYNKDFRMEVARKSSSHAATPDFWDPNFNVIVDDFIESGDTIINIIDSVFTCGDQFDLCIVTGRVLTEAVDKLKNTRLLKALVCGKIQL